MGQKWEREKDRKIGVVGEKDMKRDRGGRERENH